MSPTLSSMAGPLPPSGGQTAKPEHFFGARGVEFEFTLSSAVPMQISRRPGRSLTGGFNTSSSGLR